MGGLYNTPMYIQLMHRSALGGCTRPWCTTNKFRSGCSLCTTIALGSCTSTTSAGTMWHTMQYLHKRMRNWGWCLSFWHEAEIPVGIWVILTALSVLLTLWPPAPPDRIRSIFKSDSLMWKRVDPSPRIGITATAANEVWRRFPLSNGEMRTSRCTPTSALAYPNAYSPSSLIVAL